MRNELHICQYCRFLDDTYTDGNSRCHRYPPQAKDETHYSKPLMKSLELHLWRFPEVNKEEDWCGEWRPIPEEKSYYATATPIDKD